MILRVLGSAAGGGFPQWNCGCKNCRDVRAGNPALRPRTQDSVAASADGASWVLLNCSPDVRQQIEAFPALHPRRPRHSPIAAIVLTNGDLDHVLGLFTLRESTPLVVLATAAVQEGVRANVMYRTLERFPGQLTWRTLELGRPVEVAPGLSLSAHAAEGKVPIHLEGRAAPSPEDNIGLWLNGRVAYVPGAKSLSGLPPAEVLLLDGTFFTADELPKLGLGRAHAAEMGHLPVCDSLAHRAGRRIYTHINNTNPMLREGSPEQRAVAEAGWEIAHDGLELEL